MGLVHTSFLEDLFKQRNDNRLENYRTYESYYNGDQDVNIPKKVRQALKSELGTVCNYCRVVVNAIVDYIGGAGYSIECADSPDAEAALYEIYDANGLLDEEYLKLLTIMSKKGDAFFKLFIQNEQIKIRVLRPDIVFPRYRSDDYTELQYAAIKWFEEADEFETGSTGMWKAQVYRDDQIEYYELRGDRNSQHTQWDLTGIEENILGFIPIIHVKNTIDDLEFGISDIQVMSDLQDALNKTITDMLLTMDNTAFQRLFIFGAAAPQGSIVSLEPGSVYDGMPEGGSVNVVEAGEITHFLEAIREIVDQIATVSQISKVGLIRSGSQTPESGMALRIHYIPLEQKANKKMAILQRRFRQLNEMIFCMMALLKQGDYIGLKTKMHFQDGLPVDEQLQIQTHDMELRNKIKSRRTVMQERGVEDVDAEFELIDTEDADLNIGGNDAIPT